MNKQQRAQFIDLRLQELYPAPQIPLNHDSPFTLLVSVLLSAQCTDQRVNQVTPHLFRLANTSATMARIPVEKIETIIRPCGLAPKKSVAISQLSRLLEEQFQGQVPANFDDLESLPGVGHKTASVVMAQAFGIPAFPVDTHIHRLAQRWGLSRGKNVRQTENDLKSLFPPARWNTLHLQIIYYGREHCSARGCDGTKCQICRTCYPRRRTPPKVAKA
jgi:endonuclease-3